MNIGEEAIVRLDKQVSETKYHVTNIKTNAIGTLIVKGRLKISKENTVNAWILQYDKALNRYIYGNSYFGKYSISTNIGNRYKDIIKRLYSSPDSIKDVDVSILKGMVNRCLKKDQWDWFTTYEYIGYPDSKVMHQFVNFCVIVRDAVRLQDFSRLSELKEKYGYILNNMLFHLGEKLEETVDDINKPIATIDSDIWEKLSFDSRKNIKMLEGLKNRTSQFILMHYFVTLEKEFFRHTISPFIKCNQILKNSQCSIHKYSHTHDILVGRSLTSLGAIPYFGRYVNDKEACDNSEAISVFSSYLGSDAIPFKAICESIENTMVCGMSLITIRNGLAHGDNSIIDRLDDGAYEELRTFLLCSPSSIIERIVKISHL